MTFDNLANIAGPVVWSLIRFLFKGACYLVSFVFVGLLALSLLQGVLSFFMPNKEIAPFLMQPLCHFLTCVK